MITQTPPMRSSIIDATYTGETQSTSADTVHRSRACRRLGRHRAGLGTALSAALATVAACGLLAAPAGANTPRFVELDVAAPEAIAGGDLRGTITVRNPLSKAVVVELHDRTGENVNIDVAARSLAVAAGGHATTTFTAGVLRIGRFVVRPRVTVREADGTVLGDTDGTLGVVRTRDGVRVDPSALTSRVPAVGEPTRWSGPHDDANPLEVGDLADMVKRGGLKASSDLTGVLPPDEGDPPYDPASELDDLRQPWTGLTGPDDIASPSERPTGPEELDYKPSPISNGCIGGQLVVKTENGPGAPSKEIFGAFGWSAIITIYDVDAPLTVLREQRVELDSFGEWEYCNMTLSEINAHFAYRYESINRYVAVLDRKERTYPVYPPSNGSLYHGKLAYGAPNSASPPVDFGTLSFDSSDSEGPADVYGVGDIMRWSMEWVLSLAAAGIDPVPNVDEQLNDQLAPLHEVVYPATGAGTCVGGAPACFKWPETERVFIGPSQAMLDPFVVKHELSHSLHYRYWHHLPGGDGAHDAEVCYPTDFAAKEGFANFLAIWADNPDRPGGVEVSGYYHWGPETALAGVKCSQDPKEAGMSNETWVASALWDLADHHDDGADVTGMAQWGAVPRTWLTMGYGPVHEAKTSTMSVFEDHFKSKISPKWHPWVTGTFDQNHIPN